MPKQSGLNKIELGNARPVDSAASVDSDAHYRLGFITSGQASLCIDFKHFLVGEGCVYFTRPGQVCKLEDCSTLEGYELFFTASHLEGDEDNVSSFFSSNLLELFSDQVITLDSDTAFDIYETLERIIKEHYRIKTFQKELLKRYFRILLTYLSRQLEVNNKGDLQAGNVECVKRFLSLVDRKFKERKMVCEYASDLCISPNYLNQIVKKVTAHSASYHIRQRIVLEAQRKAIYSNQTMKQIAYSLGFNDIAHFSKMFKRVAGVNFVNFKRTKLTLPEKYAVAI